MTSLLYFFPHFQTYRRFKDLQRNKKPEPFILSELASDVLKEEEAKKERQQNATKKPVASKPVNPPQKKKEEVDILGLMDEVAKKPKPQPKKEENLFDMDFDDVPQPVSVKV